MKTDQFKRSYCLYEKTEEGKDLVVFFGKEFLFEAHFLKKANSIIAFARKVLIFDCIAILNLYREFRGLSLIL